MKGVSKDLKAAMEDVKDILKKYDINGCIFLADGLGNGEFLLGHEIPSWSMVKFKELPDGRGVAHFKTYMKTKPEESNRTVNSFYNLQEMMGNTYLANDQILKKLEDTIDIQKEEAKIISHSDYLKAQEEKERNGR